MKIFLLFVVDSTLGETTNNLKEYTIAVDGFGRPSSFNPAKSPFVRVTATRLRKSLWHYYQGEGANDPLIVEVPPGCYVPKFTWRRCRSDCPEEQHGSEDWCSDLSGMTPVSDAVAAAMARSGAPAIRPDAETVRRDRDRLWDEGCRLMFAVHDNTAVLHQEMTAAMQALAQARALLAKFPVRREFMAACETIRTPAASATRLGRGETSTCARRDMAQDSF